MNRRDMKDIVIVAAGRSACGKFGGTLKNVSAVYIGAAVVTGVLDRGVPADAIDLTVFGNAWQAGVGPNPARLIAVQAGVPVEKPAVSVNVRCGSSLQALIMGAQAIKAGDAEAVLVGGAESTSQVPYILPKARWGYRMGQGALVDVMHQDGFRCPLGNGLMGEITEPLATAYKISREEQDAYAAQSQQRAETAVKENRFEKETISVPVHGRKGETTLFCEEEIRWDGVTAEGLARLKPVFSKDGTITAGNACALADGAAALVLMEKSKAQSLGLTPLATLRGYAFIGYDPAQFGLSPTQAIPVALKSAGLSLSDIDLVELNEAFALQALACMKELELAPEKVNVNGGAIALGHPIAASGAKILTTLIYAMQERDASLGVAALCIGGGNGVAVIVEQKS